MASRAPQRARALDPVAVHGTYDDLLADPEVDIVYVALHNSAHREWVEAALRAGKHVLCEKPLGLTAGQVESMIDCAEREGRILVEACWNRWHPRTRELERLLDVGTVGEVQHITARFEGTAPGRLDFRLDAGLGGGALHDVGCYAVAALHTALGWRRPSRIEAEATWWGPGSADSTVRADLTFPGGGTAEVFAALTGALRETLEIHGSHGDLRLSPPAFTAGASASALDISTREGTTRLAFPAVDPYRLMVEQCARRIHGLDSWTVPLHQSRTVATTLDAIRTSVRGAGQGTAPEPDPHDDQRGVCQVDPKGA